MRFLFLRRPCPLVTGLPFALACLVATSPALAGRPLGTDDAGTATAGTCQVESWQDRQASETERFVGAACGLTEGLELGLELARAQAGGERTSARALALKWVPSDWQWQGWQFGLKLGLGQTHTPGAGWQSTDRTALLLASWAPHEDWGVHINAGHAHRPLDGRDARQAAAAVTWQPHPRWLVFAELTGDQHEDVGRAAGVRWWVLPDVLGLDATVQKTHRSGARTGWGLGLGWYGLKW